MIYILVAILFAILGIIAGFFLGVAGERIRSADILTDHIAAEHKRRQYITGTRGTRI